MKYVGTQVMPFLKFGTLREIVHNGSVFWVRNFVKMKKKFVFILKLNSMKIVDDLQMGFGSRNYKTIM